MRPAFSAKSGSRGKIQLRCCQGRMASSWSQRQTVLSLMVATKPWPSTSRPISALLSRDSGKPRCGQLTRDGLNLDHDSGGKNSGRPERGRSSRPARRSSKNRLRH